jgi:hypothetical protein
VNKRQQDKQQAEDSRQKTVDRKAAAPEALQHSKKQLT